MEARIWFWLFMAAWFFFGLWRDRENPNRWPLFGGHFLLFILFFILGWKNFGSPIN